jgi:hypothetical protein
MNRASAASREDLILARDLIKLGITVERQIEAQELKRSYPHTKIDRDPERGYLKIDAE